MGEFRIGRKFGQHSYPDNARAVAAALFARNFATGPKTGTAVGAGIQIPWNAIDSHAGIVTPSPNVPITPRSTGIVVISGVVSVQNNTGAPLTEVIVNVQVGGVFLPAQNSFGAPLLDASGSITIPFLAETTPTDTPVGVKKLIQIFVDGNGAVLLAEGSAVEIREMQIATG